MIGIDKPKEQGGALKLIEVYVWFLHYESIYVMIIVFLFLGFVVKLRKGEIVKSLCNLSISFQV